MVEIVIRIPQYEDVVINLSEDQLQNTRLSDLRDRVRRERGGGTLNRRLRFLYQGSLLTDATDLAKDVIGEQSRIYLLCSIGSILSADELREGEEAASRTQTAGTTTSVPEARGFDRLRGAGLAQEDIDQLRRQFGELYGLSGDVSDQTQREERWLDADGNAPDDVLPRLWDVVTIALGAFGGVFAIVFIKLCGFDWRRVQLVTAGMVLNFALTALHSIL